MKKVILAIGIIATLMSCEKETIMVERSFNYPGNIRKPLSPPQMYNIVIVERGTPCEIVMEKVREKLSIGGDEIPVFLDPYYLDGSYVKNRDPKYMAFPHIINSTKSKWNWDYFDEYVELGEDLFCEKYFNGEKTLGMKLDEWN